MASSWHISTWPYVPHFLCQLQTEIHQEGATTMSTFSFLLFAASFLCPRNVQQTTEASDLWFLLWSKNLVNSYITWNPNDPCFDWKRPCFGGLTLKNRGHLGSSNIYIYFASSPTSWSNILTRAVSRSSVHKCIALQFPATSVSVKGRAMAKRPGAANPTKTSKNLTMQRNSGRFWGVQWQGKY